MEKKRFDDSLKLKKAFQIAELQQQKSVSNCKTTKKSVSNINNFPYILESEMLFFL